MSGFLKSRMIWLLMAFLLTIAIFFVLRCYVVVLTLFFWGGVLASIYLIDKKTRLPLRELSSKRDIKPIDTLIIGDYCSRKVLSSLYNLDKSLIVMAPERSAKASLLILQHIASRLNGKNVCIIAPHNQTDVITPLDASYFSQITKLEIGIESGRIKRYSYLLLHPLMLIRVLLPFSKPKLAAPFGKDLQDYCLRKGYNLTCLQK